MAKAKKLADQRTYTVEHDSGARLTLASDIDASAMTGWEGWMPTTDDDRPVGIDLTGVKTKRALIAFATAMMVDTSGITSRTTRADIERLIIDRPTTAEEG